MGKSTDYQLAKDIVETMELHEEIHVKPVTMRFFRKYICENVKKQGANRQFTTRDEDKAGVKVVRIR